MVIRNNNRSQYTVVGTTLKTVSMYLRAAKTDAEAAGIETEGMAKSVAKLRDDILTIADVDIMIDDTTFKSTYDILDEISKKWDDILDVDRSNLLNLMGGKRNANVLASIIENFDEARAAVEAAENSAGSATKENEKWLESIEGHLNQLKVTWEEFSQTIMGSGFVKFVIDFLTNTVKLIDSVTKGLGGLGPLVLSILGNGLLNRNKWGFSTAIDGAHQRLTLFGKTIGYVGSQFDGLSKRTNAAGKEIGKLGAFWTALTDRIKSNFGGIMTKADVKRNVNLIRSYYTELQALQGNQTSASLLNSWRTNNGQFRDASKDVRKFARELTIAYTKGEDVNEMIKKFEASQESLRKGSSVWHTIGSGIANIALNLGVTVALNLAIQGIMSSARAEQDRIEQAKKAAEEFQKTYQSTNEYIGKIKTLNAELSDSNTTESRTVSIKKELVDIQDKLVETYGDEAKAIDTANSNLEIYTENLKKANKQKYEELYGTISSGTTSALNNLDSISFKLDKRSETNSKINLPFSWDRDSLNKVKEELNKIYEESGLIIRKEDQEGQITDTFIGYEGEIYEGEKRLKKAQDAILKLINDDKTERHIRDHYQDVFDYLSDVRSQYIGKLLEDNEAQAEAFIINGPAKYSDNYYKMLEARADYNYKISIAKTEDEMREARSEYDKVLEEVISEIGNEHPFALNYFQRTFEIPEEETKKTVEKIKTRVKSAYDDLQASLSDLKEEYEAAFSSKSTLQSAYDKIVSGTVLTSDEVLKLVDTCQDAFPEISNAIEKTANGYTVSAQTLINANKAIARSAEESLKSAIETYKDTINAYENPYDSRGFKLNKSQEISIEEYETAKRKVQEFELVLEMLGVSLDDTSKKGSEFNNTLKSISSTISTGASAYKEMVKNNQLSASTLESLISLGDDYVKCIKIENGVIQFNTEAFKDLTKAKLDNAIADLTLAKAEAERALVEDAQHNGFKNHERLTEMLEEIEWKLEAEKALRNGWDKEWKSAITDTSSSSDNELDKEYEKRYKDLERVNNGTLAAEKKFVSDWIALNEEMYKSVDPDKYKENLEKIVDYITGTDSKIKAHLESWGRDNGYDENDPESRYTYLNEWITASSVLDNELQQVISDLVQIEGKSNLAIKELEDFNKEFQKTYQLGNVDLTKRPKVATDNGTMTVYSSGQYVWQGDEKNGRYVYVHYTPILDDGTVLSDEEVNRYITNSLTGSGSILDADASGKRIVLKVDTDFELSDDDIKALESGQWTDSLERTTSKLDEWAVGLHEVSEEWLELTENVRSANIELAAARKAADAYDNEQLEMAKYEAETMKLEYENGDYGSYQEYADDIRALGGRYRSHDGGNLLDESFFSNIIKAEEQYNAWIADEEKKFSDSIEDRTSLLKANHEELLKHKEGTDNRTKFTTKEFEDNYSKYADDYVALIKKEVEKGIKTNEQAVEEIRKFYEQSELDGADLGSGWLTDQLIDFDSYEQSLDELKKLNDGAWQSEKDFIAKWKSLNASTYDDENSLFYDPAKYKANIQTIVDYELTELEKAFKEGEISAREYAESVSNALKDKDVLGAEFVSEKLEESDKTRAEREKSYWEQQKELATQYYDNEIKKLQKVQDAEEKVAKAEELRLNLIKARQKLEDAKSQKNQLVFHNGTFEYMADQDAIMSAEEEVANALKEIKDNELQEQIDILNEQKDDALLFYANIIGMLEYFINGTRQIESSDADIINKALESDEGNYFVRLMRGEITMDEIKDELKSKFTKESESNTSADNNATATNKAKTSEKSTDAIQQNSTDSSSAKDNTVDKENSDGGINKYVSAWQDSLLGKSILEIKDIAKSLWEQVNSKDIVGLTNSYAQDAVTSAINNVYNNSTISDDHSVNVGDITMTIQGGTSEDMLKQFASKISSAISQATTRAIAQ